MDLGTSWIYIGFVRVWEFLCILEELGTVAILCGNILEHGSAVYVVFRFSEVVVLFGEVISSLLTCL